MKPILDPSEDFAPGCKNETIFLLTTEEILVGRLILDTADLVIVQDYSCEEIRIDRSMIKTIEVGLSDMPSGFTDHLTLQQFADLVAFLANLAVT